MRSMIAAASLLTLASPALAQTSGAWSNPGLDPTFKLGTSIGGTRDKPAATPEPSRDAMTLWQYVIGQSGAAADNLMPVWQVYALAENCAAGLQVIQDVGGEFGDRARGTASLNAARARFKTWAAMEIAPAARGDRVTSSSVFKAVAIKRLIVRDQADGVLAEMTF